MEIIVLNTEINYGTFWTRRELKRLNQLAKNGATIKQMAFELRRSQGGITARLAVLRTSNLLISGNDDDTLITIRKSNQKYGNF